MKTIYLAWYDSRHFSFDAVGVDEKSAVQALIDGLNKHTIQYNCEPDWWDMEGIEVREMALGVCYRDKDTL